MEKKTKHFDMRLTESENDALVAIAERRKKTKTKVLVDYIESTAKKLGVWHGKRQ
jgi:hypothetical protein